MEKVIEVNQMIETARDFTLNDVDDAVLNQPDLSSKIKNKVQSSKNVVRNMKRPAIRY